MIGIRLSAGHLQAVLDDPATVAKLLYGDLDDDDAEMPEPDLDLDKSWHGLHFLLTGTAWDIGTGGGAAILGGDPVGEDGGYGVPQLVRPDEVRAIADALEVLDIETLRARYDPQALAAADIYPDIWDESDVFESYLAPNFLELRRFYRTAAAHDQAVLLAIT
jgi:hypothetical protein